MKNCQQWSAMFTSPFCALIQIFARESKRRFWRQNLNSKNPLAVGGHHRCKHALLSNIRKMSRQKHKRQKKKIKQRQKKQPTLEQQFKAQPIMEKALIVQPQRSYAVSRMFNNVCCCVSSTVGAIQYGTDTIICGMCMPFVWATSGVVAVTTAPYKLVRTPVMTIIIE